MWCDSENKSQGELVYENNTISGYDTFDGIKAYLYLEFDRTPETIRAMERDILSESNSVSGRELHWLHLLIPEVTGDKNPLWSVVYKR